MFDFGFVDDVKVLYKLLFKKRQMFFFLVIIMKKVKLLVYDLVCDVICIQILLCDFINKNIDYVWIQVEMDDKCFFLENIIQEYFEYKFVVFVRMKVCVDWVVVVMEWVGVLFEVIYGGKEQQEWFDVLECFCNNESCILIIIDVLVCGIDIFNVDYVINYDVLEDFE